MIFPSGYIILTCGNRFDNDVGGQQVLSIVQGRHAPFLSSFAAP